MVYFPLAWALNSFGPRFIRMYPRGDEYSTNSLSMYLFPQSWDKLLPEPGMMIELTLSILNQNNAQLHKVSGSAFPWQILWNEFICRDCFIFLQHLILSLSQSQVALSLLVRMAGDGPTSSRSTNSRILSDQAALSRQTSPSSGHPVRVRLWSEEETMPLHPSGKNTCQTIYDKIMVASQRTCLINGILMVVKMTWAMDAEKNVRYAMLSIYVELESNVMFWTTFMHGWYKHLPLYIVISVSLNSAYVNLLISLCCSAWWCLSELHYRFEFLTTCVCCICCHIWFNWSSPVRAKRAHQSWPQKNQSIGPRFFFPVPYKSQDYVCAGGGVDQLR